MAKGSSKRILCRKCHLLVSEKLHGPDSNEATRMGRVGLVEVGIDIICKRSSAYHTAWCLVTSVADLSFLIR